MGKLQGPQLVDFLDLPNADKKQSIPTSPNYTKVWIVLIITIALLFASLVVYVLLWLNYHYATVALWIINISVLCAIVGSVFVGLFYLVTLAVKHATYTLNDGVPVNVFRVLFARYNPDYATMRYFDMWQERMKHSQFSGVSTLTLDQSVQSETSTTSVRTEDPEPVTTEPEPNVSTLEDLKSKGLINRSDQSLFVGFAHDAE